MSTDSGLPDYRGEGGKWAADPVSDDLYGNTPEERSRGGDWFRSDPSAAWGNELSFCDSLAAAEPHEGYALLASLGIEGLGGPPLGVFVVTSNVDAMHERSGLDRSSIYPCFGELFSDEGTESLRVQCSGGLAIEDEGMEPCEGDSRGVWSVDRDTIVLDEESGRADPNSIPVCTSCLGPARPNLLYFEDRFCHIEHISLNSPRRENMVKWLDALESSTAARNRDSGAAAAASAAPNGEDEPQTHLVVLEIGVGTVVTTVRDRCKRAARDHKSRTTYIRINKAPEVLALDADEMERANLTFLPLQMSAIVALVSLISDE
jgi:NAD-dependent SIR2 family protein deacetylase